MSLAGTLSRNRLPRPIVAALPPVASAAATGAANERPMLICSAYSNRRPYA